jgi:hypothetical protein
MDRFTVAGEVTKILDVAGIPKDAQMHIWDRLVDGLSKDSEQELAALYAMLRPDDSKFIFIRDGRVSSPKEPGAIAYRRV